MEAADPDKLDGSARPILLYLTRTDSEVAKKVKTWELAQLRESTLEDVEYQYALQVPEERDAPIRGRVRVTFIRNDPDDREDSP